MRDPHSNARGPHLGGSRPHRLLGARATTTCPPTDCAGQFNVLLHALCWIHANRAIDKIIPLTDKSKENLVAVKDQIWQLYKRLKAYRQKPTPAGKKRLSTMFDKIFTQTTASASLNLALKRIYNNKAELLLVLNRPDIPLHNNGAENAIRE